MKICIYGAGAIGGYLAVGLSRTGAEVTLVARGAHLAAMRANGLRLLIEGRQEVARLPCTDDPTTLGRQDYVIIALKAHSIPDAVESVSTLLDDDTTIVTASNGLPYWFFHVEGVPFQGATLPSIDDGGKQRDLLRPERAVGCVVFPATEIVEPGVIRHEHGGKFPIGEPDGKRTPRIERLRDLLVAAGFDAPIRDNIRDEIWLKLWGNMCFNPVSALTCATIDKVATDAGTRAICVAMMREMQAIGSRLGLHLRVDAERRLAGAAALGAHKMSMLQDLERGRPMEIESLVGVVRELGSLTGVPTPVVDVVYGLIDLRQREAPIPTFAPG